MSTEMLHRSDAPFGPAVWQQVDAAVITAATSQITARRLLEIEGPYGLGLKVIPGTDTPSSAPAGESVVSAVSPTVPVAVIQAWFSIPIRDIAHFEQTGLPFDLNPAAQAALSCARQEDELIFNGSAELGTAGLLTAAGTCSCPLRPWDKPGQALDNLVEAVGVLDEAGMHGPYALGLAPKRYNALFRRYPDGNMTEMDHVRTLVTGGIIKAPALTEGAVLLATGKQFASIVLGQDLVTGFVGPSGGTYEFFLIESLALRLAVPAAVCVLR